MSRLLTVNPVLSRELRQRVRSRRASVVLTVYLSLLVGAVGLLVWGFEQSNSDGPAATSGLGQTLFGSLLFAVLGLVCFIVPGVAAGAVAGERERLTLMPLQVTLLTPGQILRGKLLASLAFTTLLLVATLPLLAVAYVLGGVSASQIAGGLFFVLATAAFLGVLSIWASTVLRRVQRATVVAYGLVGLLVVGTMIGYGVQMLATTTTTDGEGNARWESLLFVAPNPFIVTADALGHDVDISGASPFTPSQSLLQRRDDRRRGTDRFGDTFAGGPARIEDAAVQVAPVGPVPFPAPTLPAAPPPPAIAVPVPARAPFVTTTILSAAPAGVGRGHIPPPPPPPPPTTVVDPRTGAPFGFDPSTGGPVFDPSGNVIGSSGSGPVFGPNGNVIGSSGGMVTEDEDAFRPGRSGGDITDRGPIWAWTFGWWAILGGAAYAHATRKLRLPSLAGVRP